MHVARGFSSFFSLAILASFLFISIEAKPDNPIRDESHGLISGVNIPLPTLSLMDRSHPSYTTFIGGLTKSAEVKEFFAPRYLFLVEPQMRSGTSSSAPLWLLGINYCDLRRGYEIGLQPFHSGGTDGMAASFKIDLSPDRTKIIEAIYSKTVGPEEAIAALEQAARGLFVAGYSGFSSEGHKDWTANVGITAGHLVVAPGKNGGSGVTGIASFQGLVYHFKPGNEQSTGIIGLGLTYQDQIVHFDPEADEVRKWRFQLGAEYQRDTANRLRDTLNVFTRFRLGPISKLYDARERIVNAVPSEDPKKRYKATKAQQPEKTFDSYGKYLQDQQAKTDRSNINAIYSDFYEVTLFANSLNTGSHIFGAKISKAF